jgi:TM2 domain-containing membrane protein YozV
VTDPWASSQPTEPVPAPYPPTAPLPVEPYRATPPGPAGFSHIPGQDYSDRSKIVAGLLQLVPGFLIALGGLGRLYAGHRGLGIAQLAVTMLGWVALICGFGLVFPWAITGLAWIWFVIDGIVLMAGRPVDRYGRILRG